MKRKIFSILFAFVLVCSFSLVTAVPAAAQAPTPTVTFVTRDTGTAAWSADQPHSGLRSAKMTTIVGNDAGMARFEFGPGELTLDDLTTLSYWEYVSARKVGTFVDVFIDIWLDFDGDGDADAADYPGYMQAEPLYTVGAAPLNTWTPIDAMNLMWSTYVGPDDPYHAPTIYDFQANASGPCVHNYTMADWNDGVDFGPLSILRIDIRVGYGGTWDNFTGYADDIVINSYTQGFEPLDEVWVDDNFGPSTTIGWGYDSFATIPDGIDAVAEAGTVNVLAGDYDGGVVVNKVGVNVVASGAQVGSAPFGDGYDGGFEVAASEVQIKGFVLIGGGSGKGVLILEEAGLSWIRNNTTIGYAEGISTEFSGGVGSSGNIIEFNDVSGAASVGIYLQTGLNNSVQDNGIFDSGHADITVDDEDGVTITDNFLYGSAPIRVELFNVDADALIPQLLEDNFFDTAVIVNHPGASLLPAIWGKIQPAVNAAVAGDTVLVEPGQYNGNVHIVKRLTLQGAGSGDDPASNTIITPPPAGLTLPIPFPGFPNTTGNGIDIHMLTGSPAEPTLVIQNLRVTGAPKDGIQITDSSNDANQGNWTLNDVACIGNGKSGYGMGVDLNLNAAAYAEDVTVTDSVFNDNNNFGFKINHGAGSVKITITGGEMNGNQSGIQALCHPDHTRVISVDGVTFEGNTAVGVDFGAHDDYGFNDGVVSLQNLIVVDNGIGMRFKGEGVASTYGPGFLLPAGTISVLYCAIIENDTGVLIQDYSALDNMSLHYNNFCGNTVGLDNQCADTVDATNNFWCDPSGPKHNPGYGDPVSGDVLFNPWLLGPFVPGDPLPATFDKTLALNIGWTLVSTDNWIDAANTVGVGVIAAYKYTPGTPGGYTSVDPTALVPVDALYLKTEVGGALGINYLGGVPVASSKNLEAGWNLVSSATLDNAKAVLSPLRYIDVGDEQGVGLTTVVSQGPFNQHTGSFYLSTFGIFDWGVLGQTMLNPFDGYWVYMNDGKVFGVVPGH